MPFTGQLGTADSYPGNIELGVAGSLAPTAGTGLVLDSLTLSAGGQSFAATAALQLGSLAFTSTEQAFSNVAGLVLADRILTATAQQPPAGAAVFRLSNLSMAGVAGAPVVATTAFILANLSLVGAGELGGSPYQGAAALTLSNLTLTAIGHAPTGIIPLGGPTIEDALSARYAPLVLGYRYEWRTARNVFLADITEAVLLGGGCSIENDNERPVQREATFHFRADLLPDGFTATEASNTCVAVFTDVLVGDVTESYQRGLFFLDQPQVTEYELGYTEWEAKSADPLILLANRTTTTTYYLSAGASYTSTVRGLCRRAGLQLIDFSDPRALPTDVSWPPQTSYLTICNDILRGICWKPLAADSDGRVFSVPLIDPALETPAVHYDTTTEPKLLHIPAQRQVSVAQYKNWVSIALDDPNRFDDAAGYTANFTNDDPACPLSVITAQKQDLLQLTGGGSDTTKCVYDGPTADALATVALQYEASRATTRTIRTALDPRRTAFESYTLTIDGYEDDTLWRVTKWTEPCEIGGEMEHELGLADPVAITAGSPPITTATSLGTYTAGPYPTALYDLAQATFQVSVDDEDAVVVAVLTDAIENTTNVIDSGGTAYSLAATSAVFGPSALPWPVAGAGRYHWELFVAAGVTGLAASGATVTVTSDPATTYGLAVFVWSVTGLQQPLFDAPAIDSAATDATGAATQNLPDTDTSQPPSNAGDLVLACVGALYPSNAPNPDPNLEVDHGEGWDFVQEQAAVLTGDGSPATIAAWVELQVAIGTPATGFRLSGLLNRDAAAWGTLLVTLTGTEA